MFRENYTEDLNARIVRGPNYDYRSCLFSDDVWVKQLPQGYLAEYLNRDIMAWVPETRIGIFVPTGAGKNYFVEHEIFSYAKFLNKRVLIISNRVALNRQIKRRLAKYFHMEHIFEELSEEEIDKKTDFEFVTAVLK